MEGDQVWKHKWCAELTFNGFFFRIFCYYYFKGLLDGAVLIANEIVDEKRRLGEKGVVFKIDFFYL